MCFLGKARAYVWKKKKSWQTQNCFGKWSNARKRKECFLLHTSDDCISLSFICLAFMIKPYNSVFCSEVSNYPKKKKWWWLLDTNIKHAFAKMRNFFFFFFFLRWLCRPCHWHWARAAACWVCHGTCRDRWTVGLGCGFSKSCLEFRLRQSSLLRRDTSSRLAVSGWVLLLNHKDDDDNDDDKMMIFYYYY